MIGHCLSICIHIASRERVYRTPEAGIGTCMWENMPETNHKGSLQNTRHHPHQEKELKPNDQTRMFIHVKFY